MVQVVRDSTLQSQKASSVEEEDLKRNTDCVYFLASPLTCKKGSECEYRHSETSRLNPRDCRYWLSSYCLNPKCAFRHPPIDGLSSSHTSTTKAIYNPGKQINAIYNQGKHMAPCVFFRKGFCSKGDRCAFSHGICPVSNTIQQAPVTLPVCEPSNAKEASSFLRKCSQSQANVPKLTKPLSNSESYNSRIGIVTEKSYPEPMGSNEVSSSRVEKIPAPASNENGMEWSNHIPQFDLSGDQDMDGDEIYRESSPGFDDELRDSDRYLGGDQFGRRDLNDFDDSESDDFNQVEDGGREVFCVHQRGFDSYDHRRQNRVLCERNSVRSDSGERWGLDYCCGTNVGRMENSGLRHCLKQRKVNGLRPVVSHDNAPNRFLSSRLFGRINLPERSMHHPKGFNYDERNIRRSRSRRDTMTTCRTDFTGPKSLAELKVGKTSSGNRTEQQIKEKGLLSNRKRANSFEGPMPFSEILKRKRGAESNKSLVDGQENSSEYANGHLSSSK